MRTHKGLLDSYGSGALIGLFDALGVMSRRGIGAADRVVEKMASIDYWRKAPFHWYTDEGLKKRPEFEFEPLAWLLWGYGLSGKTKRVGELSSAILKGIENAKTRKYVAWRLDPERLAIHPERVRRQEQLPLTAAWRKALADAHDEHAATVARLTLDKGELTQEEERFLRAAVAEALAAYEKARSGLLEGGIEAVKGRLLDNAKILDDEKLKRIGAELDADVRREQAALQALAERKTTPVSFQVERRVTYGLPTVPEAEGKLAASRAEEVTVTWRLSGSAEVGRVLFPRLRGRLTIAQDGTLIVYMKKIDGRWYWNPFGW
ncbi:hypothetical protein HQ576_06620 [bacterium]|nr:hypothetical protein [bacterium]